MNTKLAGLIAPLLFLCVAQNIQTCDIFSEDFFNSGRSVKKAPKRYSPVALVEEKLEKYPEAIADWKKLIMELSRQTPGNYFSRNDITLEGNNLKLPMCLSPQLITLQNCDYQDAEYPIFNKFSPTQTPVGSITCIPTENGQYKLLSLPLLASLRKCKLLCKFGCLSEELHTLKIAFEQVETIFGTTDTRLQKFSWIQEKPKEKIIYKAAPRDALPWATWTILNPNNTIATHRKAKEQNKIFSASFSLDEKDYGRIQKCEAYSSDGKKQSWRATEHTKHHKINGLQIELPCLKKEKGGAASVNTPSSPTPTNIPWHKFLNNKK